MHANNNLHYQYLSTPTGFIDFVPAIGGDYSTFNGSSLDYAYSHSVLGKYDSLYNKDITSGYVSEVFSPIEGLNIMGGLRYENVNHKNGYLAGSNLDAYKQSAWSPKAGIVYQIIKDQFSIFGNYQNSFKSNGYYISDNRGNNSLSDPERANQFEGGFKANLLKGRINATVSYYDIQVKNTLIQTTEAVKDANGNVIPYMFVQSQAGKQASKGVELEVNAYLVKGFSVIGGIAYNDSKYVISDASTQGRRPATAGSPWLANFYASYQFLDGNLKGLGFGFGGNYANDNKIVNTFNTLNNKDNVFTLPKYLVLNANAFYDAKKFRIGVKVDNLTNQLYWIGNTTANPQTLINVLGTVTYKFK